MADELIKNPEAEKQTGAPATLPIEGEQIPKEGESESRFQKRIDQLTAARRAAEERAHIAEERLQKSEKEKIPFTGEIPGHEQRMVGKYSKDQWLEWHDEDPLAANEYLADLKAEQKAQQYVGQMRAANNYAETVNEVFKAHPELKEVVEGKKTAEEAPFYKVFDEVAMEMPELRGVARGPYIVMKEAERRVKEKELLEKEKQIKDTAATDEANRQQRVGAGYTLGSQSKGPVTSSVKLSPDEEKIARKMGMTPEEYAKNKKVK